MNIAPGRIPGADFQHHEVKRAQASSDVRIFGRQSRIAAEEHTVVSRTYRDRRPKGRVASSKRTPGEVLGGRSRDAHSARDFVRLPPIKLRDSIGVNAPELQMSPDSERSHERD